MLKNPWCTKASNVPITDYTSNQTWLMENVSDRSREEFLVKEGQTCAHPWGPNDF